MMSDATRAGLTCPRCQSNETRRTGSVPRLQLDVWLCAVCTTRFTSRTDTRDLPSVPSASLVLNVDDRVPSLYTRRRILERNGFTVADAVTGRQAWSSALVLRPRAILLDVHLPDADGRELCREMRSNRDLQSIPVVLISATVAADEVPDPRMWGAVEFLREPVAPSTLSATMRRALGQP